MLYVIAGIVLIVTVYIYFKPQKKLKIKKLPIIETPKKWHNILAENVLFYRNLTGDEQKKFRSRMFYFLKETNIEAVNFQLDLLDKLLVGASAVIPVFRFENWQYSNLTTVLIYPDYFDEDLQFSDTKKSRNIAGLVGSGRFEGQMILSRKALHHGFKNTTDKGNTAVHEFIHLLDKSDGIIDGVPSNLLEKQYIIPWLQLMHNEMETINNDKSDIRNYGGTSQIEFLAVTSEYFFERPKLFKRKHPELYKMLEKCFVRI